MATPVRRSIAARAEGASPALPPSVSRQQTVPSRAFVIRAAASAPTRAPQTRAADLDSRVQEKERPSMVARVGFRQ
jgi:hypothetical protein